MTKRAVDLVVDSLLDTLIDNSLFMQAFCSGCEAGKVRYDEECPAGWCPSEPECERWGNWSDISEAIRKCVSASMKA